MKKPEMIILALCSLTTSITAQQSPELIPADTIELNILQVDPRSFPNVTVSFKAIQPDGIPFRSIEQKNLSLYENGKLCPIDHLTSFSRPVSVSIVIDRSASMEEDPAQLYDKNGNPLFSIDADNNMVVAENYVSPLDNAKTAIREFVSGFNLKQDEISITSFSSSVDKPLSLTSKAQSIQHAIDALQPEGKTALYDGMLTGLDQLKQAKGLKILIVLTDGLDNRSHLNADDVINIAAKEGIPVYLIGLGKVNTAELQKIADETRGQFYYTNSASSLNTIYTAISKQVQHSFSIRYTSTDLNPKDRKRAIRLIADQKGIYVIPASASTTFSGKLIASAKNENLSETEINISKEEPVMTASTAKSRVSYGQLGKLALACSVAAGVLLVKRKIHPKTIA
jgi:Ca-activated chloride channel family protein